MLVGYVLNNSGILVINQCLKICTLNLLNVPIKKVVYGNFNYNFSPFRRKESSSMLSTVLGGCYVSRVVCACADFRSSGL
jgi:hypothetical protein